MTSGRTAGGPRRRLTAWLQAVLLAGAILSALWTGVAYGDPECEVWNVDAPLDDFAIVHLTDLHVGGAVRGQTPSIAVRLRDRMDDLVDGLLERLGERLGVIVVSGDLLHEGDFYATPDPDDSKLYLTDLVEHLRNEEGLYVVAVPGNHDYRIHRSGVEQMLRRQIVFDYMTEEFPSTCVPPYPTSMLDPDCEYDLSQYPKINILELQEGERIALIGLNSMLGKLVDPQYALRELDAKGLLGDAQLDRLGFAMEWVDEATGVDVPSCDVKVVYLHHNPFQTVSPSLDLIDATELLDTLKSVDGFYDEQGYAPVSAVLCGHIHESFTRYHVEDLDVLRLYCGGSSTGRSAGIAPVRILDAGDLLEEPTPAEIAGTPLIERAYVFAYAPEGPEDEIVTFHRWERDGTTAHNWRPWEFHTDRWSQTYRFLFPFEWKGRPFIFGSKESGEVTVNEISPHEVPTEAYRGDWSAHYDFMFPLHAGDGTYVFGHKTTGEVVVNQWTVSGPVEVYRQDWSAAYDFLFPFYAGDATYVFGHKTTGEVVVNEWTGGTAVEVYRQDWSAAYDFLLPFYSGDGTYIFGHKATGEVVVNKWTGETAVEVYRQQWSPHYDIMFPFYVGDATYTFGHKTTGEVVVNEWTDGSAAEVYRQGWSSLYEIMFPFYSGAQTFVFGYKSSGDVVINEWTDQGAVEVYREEGWKTGLERIFAYSRGFPSPRDWRWWIDTTP